MTARFPISGVWTPQHLTDFAVMNQFVHLFIEIAGLTAYIHDAGTTIAFVDSRGENRHHVARFGQHWICSCPSFRRDAGDCAATLFVRMARAGVSR